MVQVCLFDVNETLLDLGALDPHFERAFGVSGVRQQWFAQFIQNAFIATITGHYQPFGAIGAAALDMIAARREVPLSSADRGAILGGIRELPPYPEVRAALDRLRGAGIRLATLTNSTAEVAAAQLAHAGLIDIFEKTLSADEVQHLKPTSEPYHYAAKCAFRPNGPPGPGETDHQFQAMSTRRLERRWIGHHTASCSGGPRVSGLFA